MTQAELFPESDYHDAAYENPMVVLLGKGPAGVNCKNCVHLFSKRSNSKSFRKCELRGDTNGYGTDHKVRYHACSQYREVMR